MLRSQVCEGWVVHRRRAPLEHSFRYPVWMLLTDVDDPHAGASRWLSRSRRLAPLSLRPEDFPRRNAESDIRAAVNARLTHQGLAPAERVFLLTQPRSWGWLFNPVSFYFCYRSGRLAQVIAEITNTPWDEVYSYVLPVRDGAEEVTFDFPKRFHVSPFMPMDVDYQWRIKLDGDAIEIAMRVLRDGDETFFAGLYLHGEPMTDRALRRGALVYPLQNARTLARIYWQAFRLWCKGAPFHPHPRHLEEARST